MHRRLMISSCCCHQTREKMIYMILLLISLTCCVSGTVEVNPVQRSYYAEVNQDITLEWTVTTDDGSSLESSFIFCTMSREETDYSVFNLNEGVEDRMFQHRQFERRVQCDRAALKEGLLRLRLSSVRERDSGRYECEVMNSSGAGMGRTQLGVIGAKRKLVTAKGERQVQSSLCVGLSLLTAALFVGL